MIEDETVTKEAIDMLYDLIAQHTDLICIMRKDILDLYKDMADIYKMADGLKERIKMLKADMKIKVTMAPHEIKAMKLRRVRSMLY